MKLPPIRSSSASAPTTLTQANYGFSRDDINTFLPTYLSQGILKNDPFEIPDQKGVGEMMKIGIERGRKANPRLKIGIYGEHGGDPSSAEFCHSGGPNLCFLLALPGADGPPSRGAGGSSRRVEGGSG